MDYSQIVMNYLREQGFYRLKHDKLLLWLREEEGQTGLAAVLPARLPGQPRISIAFIEEEMDQIERQLMIRRGKRVERIVLLFCSGLPEEDLLKESLAYHDIWWVDQEAARILIYEEQRADFLGMKSHLERFLAVCKERQSEQKRTEMMRAFQPVTTALALLNILIFLILNMGLPGINGAAVMEKGIMSWDAVSGKGQYYRLVTSMFLHFSLDHLFQNMLVLLLTGSRLERAIGRIRYLILYLGAGLAGSAASLFFTLQGTDHVSAGASGAIFGIMGGMICLILKDSLSKQKNYIREIGLRGILFMAACSASYGFFSTGVDNAAHLGGLAGGFLLAGLLTTGSHKA